MNKSKLKATIFIVVLLLAAAAIAAVVTGNMSKKPPAESDTPSAAVTPAPDAPGETDEPEITDEPEVSEEPVQTAPPVVSREVTGSGTFSSDTGTPLNLVVSYSAKAGAGDEVIVTFDVYLSCYSINASAKPGGVSLSFNGGSYTDSSPELDVHSDTVTSVRLCTKEVTINLPAGETLTSSASVSWAFGGSYSEVELKTIEASGTVSIAG